MRYKKVKDWIPADNLSLEPNALTATKSSFNTLIVAGPGAGKTELLAQRACFLLETNTCRYPHKILAISFKRDAAYNLKDRVLKRCGKTLARRFESLTFDAFAKIILDRFYLGLSDDYKISAGYDILVQEKIILDKYKANNLAYYNQHTRKQILDFHHSTLPLKKDTTEEKLRWNIWQDLLTANTPKVSFRMIMLLAQYIIHSNPKVKTYLQMTYSHVFLDEFQDTTFLQYNFFNTCFASSKTIFTAVGDDKQRIMIWAGAFPKIFTEYIKCYNAKKLPLFMNFRSAPRLVALQNYLISELLNKQDITQASDKWDDNQGESTVFIYDTPQKETEHLFKKVHKLINEDNLNPRDICILVKQQLSTYAGSLIDYFNANGLNARDENQLQDLLTEEVILFIINVILIVSKEKVVDGKIEALKFLATLNNSFDDSQLLALEHEFNQLIGDLRKKIKQSKDNIDIVKVVKAILDFASISRIRANYTQYKDIKFLEFILKQLVGELRKNYNESKNLGVAADILLGKNSIPVMTIHKSKGLEYHTVIFVGLEDGAFWSFEKQPDEDKCSFFVALSRAKERIIFTFSKQRYDKWGTLKSQSIDKIMIFFKTLQDSKLVDFYTID
ncbi:UvrD-helicase domain-containing protein [Aureispira sp. CCB-QB1]|uniref:UvrD-helicase domain-containing protein n=1 Tax=Aureispira sp. CCB-QB1 TaxID=1313421 RepID=UPI000697C5A8|nr:ATP-dependent helicase [Aureispira sp. CCB-QB1]